MVGLTTRSHCYLLFVFSIIIHTSFFHVGFDRCIMAGGDLVVVPHIQRPSSQTASEVSHKSSKATPPRRK
jgi:hypothetical protein